VKILDVNQTCGSPAAENASSRYSTTNIYRVIDLMGYYKYSTSYSANIQNTYTNYIFNNPNWWDAEMFGK